MGGNKCDSSASPPPSSSSSWFSRFCFAAGRKKIVTLNGSTTTTIGNAVHTNSGEELVRRLGLLDLLLLGIGASIGAGIFVVTGTVARDAGPAVTISFLLAGVSCVLNALCYAELSSRFPALVGGAYLYTYAAFNELTAFLVFSQLMIDYHIGAASIARSLASYIIALLELSPIMRDKIPDWLGHHGGEELLGGVLSINILVPLILIVLTVVLCLGVKESSSANSIMTVTKVVIVIIIVFVGAFKVDVSNWSPFAPNGVKAVFTGATVVFFAYVGFDAVANSAEESKRPQRDLPIGILGSLLICAVLYIGVCLVITGMVPYSLLGEDAPLADAFASKGLKFVKIFISIGAVAGLTTTLLVGLYVQSRLYLGLGRDGLLPAIFARVHANRHTPINSQVWVGLVASVLGGLFNVHMLSHILSVGTLTGYSVVSASLVVLRRKEKKANQTSPRWISSGKECVLCLFIVGCCGFVAGVSYRFDGSIAFPIIAGIAALLAALALYYRQVYEEPAGFSCPGVPFLPIICIFFNIFLFSQLHYEAWVRFVVLSIITAGVYVLYGQYHADPKSEGIMNYHRVPVEDGHH